MIPAGVKKLLAFARSKKATDIHICADAPILFRVGKDLMPSSEGRITPEMSERIAMELLTEEQAQQFRKDNDFDFMIADEDGRYRVNVSMNDQSVGLVIRILSEDIMTLDRLGLPPAVNQLAEQTKGLILITGSTSQGKTTTMTAILNEINSNFRRNIVTIEDPIENIHINKKSIVRHREVGRDTESFYRGLRAALRQDPDVIAIGEMRDYETIRIALTAAETGVLVISTLHIISIDKMIERILSYAPGEDHGHMRYLLAGTLQGVIHQELLPATDGGKRMACEILLGTNAVKNIIRRRDAFMLRDIINTSSRHGMVSMRTSVSNLLEKGLITDEVAQDVMVNY